MASALDDEEQPDVTTGSTTEGYGQTAPAGAYSALGAGDMDTLEAEAETGQDYGGGADQGVANGANIPPSAIIPLLQRNRSFQKLSPEMQQQIIAMAQKRSGVKDTRMPEGPDLSFATAAAPPKEDASVISRALLRAEEDTSQSSTAMRGGMPEPSKVPQADFETGIGLADLSSPGLLAKKLGFELIRGGVAQLPAGMVGARVGAGIGAAVGGPVGAGIGGVIGTAGAMGLAAGFQDIGPAYLAEAAKTPDDLDGAWERTKVEAVKSGLVSAASMAFFDLPIIKPFVKGLFVTPVKDAVAAAPESLKSRFATQAIGQTTIPAAGQAGANVVEGKPVTEGLPEASASGIPNVAIDILTRGAGRLVTRGLRREQPGVDADQAEALAATEETPPPPFTPGPPGGELLRRPPPGQEPTPGYVPPGGSSGPGGTPPPGGGIGGAQLGPEQAVPGAPGGVLLRRPPLPEAPPEAAPPPEPPPAPVLGPSRIQEQYGNAPPEPLPAPPVEPAPSGMEARGYGAPGEAQAAAEAARLATEPPPPPEPPPSGGGGPPPEPTPPPTPPPGLSRIQERFGTAPPPEPVAPVEQPVASRIQERFGTGAEQPTGFTARVEPDHLDKTRSVAKNEAGDVIGKGATPQEAIHDAVTRKGEPYAEQATAAEAAAAEGTTAEPVIGKEAPPVEAGTEPAAQVKERAGSEAVTPPVRAASDMSLTELRNTLKKDFGEDAPLVNRSPRSKLEELYNKHVAEGTEAPVEAAAKPAAEQVKDKAAAAKEAKLVKAAETKAEILAKAKEAAATNPEFIAFMKAQERAAAEAAARKAEGKPEPTEKSAPAPVTEEQLPEVKGTTTRAGAFSMGEGREVTREKAPPRSTSTPMSREAVAEIRGMPGGEADTKPRLPETPSVKVPAGNLNRRGRYLVEQMLENNMSPRTAHGMYGVQAPVGERGGKAGRPRANATLLDFVRDALDKAKDPRIEAGIRDQMAEVEKRLKSAQGKAAEVANAALADLKSQLEHEARVKRNVAGLNAIRKELEGLARGKVESRATRRDYVHEGYQAVTRRILASESQRPEINEPLLRILESKPVTNLYSYLDSIINNRRAAPQHVVLAKVLRKILPDMEVHAVPDGLGVPLGSYDSIERRIELNAEHLRDMQGHGYSTITTVLHEALHAATHDYIERLYSGDPLTPTELAHKQALEAIAYEVRDVVMRDDVGKLDNMHLGPGEIEQLKYAGVLYGNSDALHEVITQLMSNPEAMGALATIPASERLKTTLDSIGMGRGVSTLWDAFKSTLRSVFGLGPKEDSILDHILRPLSEITETGASYSAQRRAASRVFSEVRDETVRHNENVLEASPAARTALSSRELRDAAGRGGINILDRSRRGGLRAAFISATFDAIHDFIKPILPGITEHRAAKERVAESTRNEVKRLITTTGADGRPIQEANLDKTLRLYDNLRKGPDGDRLAALMNDATLNEVVLDARNPQANAHLTEAGRRVRDTLQATFDSLHPAAQQTYREVRDLFRDWYERERHAGINTVVNYAFPDMDQATREAMVKQMQTREGVMEVLQNPDNSAIAKQMGVKWENKKALAQQIAELQRAGFVQGDYFPLRRYGDYILTYGKPNTAGYGVEMFETRAAANQRRSELLAGDPGKGIAARTDVSQIFNKSLEAQRRLVVPEQALNTLGSAMDRAGLAPEAQALLRDLYAGQLIQQGTRAATRTMRREGIPGASKDQARNLLNDFIGYTTRIGHLEHGGEVINTLNQMEKAYREMHQPGSNVSASHIAIADLGIHELRQRLAALDGDTSADAIGKAARVMTTWSFMSNLMRPAQTLINLVDTYTSSAALMGARHGLSAPAAIARAMGELSGSAVSAAGRNMARAMRGELHTANWDLSDLYRARLEKVMNPEHANLLIDRLNQSGLIDQTKTRELRRMAGPDGFGGNYFTRAMDLFSAGEHAADSMSRTATAKAAFELELAKTKGDVNAALDYAVQMARDTQPNYNPYNKSRLVTGGTSSFGRLFAPLMTQFKQFGLHMYGVQGNLLVNGLRAAKGSAERREQLAAWGLLQGSHALLSGVNTAVFGGLPMMVGMGLYDLVMGDNPHTNAQLDTALRNYVYDKTGSRTASEMFSVGVGAGLGLDVHRSVQFSNLGGVEPLKTFDMAGVADFVFKTMTGAAGQTAATTLQGMKQMANGDFTNMPKVMPRTIHDIYDAVMMANYGVKDAKGNLMIVPPDKLSYLDLAEKAIGFNPTAVSTPRAARAAIQLEETVAKDNKTPIIDRFVQASAADKPAMLQEINRYNLANPGDPINKQAIQHRVREQAINAAMPGLYGAHVPRSQMIGAQQVARFAQ